MNRLREKLLLYAVTDRRWVGKGTFVDQVKAALDGGVTFVQLREKGLDYGNFLKLAVDVKNLTDRYGVPFVINDNVDIAVACGADGIHVGQSDLNAELARQKLGIGKIIGVSTTTVEQSVLAEKQGADYLGVGAMFPTNTKLNADLVSIQTLKDICQSVSIPVVAIGSIKPQNILSLSGTGIAGVAVVSAIFAQSDIRKSTQELLNLAKSL